MSQSQSHFSAISDIRSGLCSLFILGHVCRPSIYLRFGFDRAGIIYLWNADRGFLEPLQIAQLRLINELIMQQA